MLRGIVLGGFFLLLIQPARADVAEAVTKHVLPGYAAFANAAAALDQAAAADCRAESLRPAYNLAFDAWLGVAHLHLGPVEDEGRSLAIAFWPDPKGLGAKVQAAMFRSKDPAAADPAAFAEVSVAARGLFGLERLLYPDSPLSDGGYACALTRATAHDLARMAMEVEKAWRGDYAQSLLTAGEAGDTRYLSMTEARQALFTQLIAGLEFNADQRLGRPMGTFDKPRPERAEARASGRSLRNLEFSLAALSNLAETLVPASPETQAALARAQVLAAGIEDPVFASVTDPGGRLDVEALQQAVHAARDAALAEIAPALGAGVGFNAGDGD